MALVEPHEVYGIQLLLLGDGTIRAEVDHVYVIRRELGQVERWTPKSGVTPDIALGTGGAMLDIIKPEDRLLLSNARSLTVSESHTIDVTQDPADLDGWFRAMPNVSSMGLRTSKLTPPWQQWIKQRSLHYFPALVEWDVSSRWSDNSQLLPMLAASLPRVPMLIRIAIDRYGLVHEVQANPTLRACRWALDIINLAHSLVGDQVAALERFATRFANSSVEFDSFSWETSDIRQITDFLRRHPELKRVVMTASPWNRPVLGEHLMQVDHLQSLVVNADLKLQPPSRWVSRDARRILCHALVSDRTLDAKQWTNEILRTFPQLERLSFQTLSQPKKKGTKPKVLQDAVRALLSRELVSRKKARLLSLEREFLTLAPRSLAGSFLPLMPSIVRLASLE